MYRMRGEYRCAPTAMYEPSTASPTLTGGRAAPISSMTAAKWLGGASATVPRKRSPGAHRAASSPTSRAASSLRVTHGEPLPPELRRRLSRCQNGVDHGPALEIRLGKFSTVSGKPSPG